MQIEENVSFRSGVEPRIIAAGRLLSATATAVGTPEWSGINAVNAPTGIHPGFAAAIVDTAPGDYTVATNFDMTTLTCVVLATSETINLIVDAIRLTATTIRITCRSNAGALVEADVGIMILGI
jgi:hypothetical protein